MLTGFARVAAQEHPELRLQTIDVDAFDSAVVGALLAPPQTSTESERAVRQRALWAPRLQTAQRSADASLTVREDGAYIVTGASSGLGLLAAEHLVARGARHLVLVARKTSVDTFNAAVSSMRERGARIDVAPGTVADEAFVRAIASRLSADGVALRGVV